MKALADRIQRMSQEEISLLEEKGSVMLEIEGENLEVLHSDTEILSKEIGGYKVANEGRITVALDVNISDSLRQEGIARELVSKLQALRKETNLDVTDKIRVKIVDDLYVKDAINQYKTYICSEILATDIHLENTISEGTEITVDEISLTVQLEKVN